MEQQNIPISKDTLEQAKKIASSDIGKQLFDLLNRSDPDAVQQAMQQAAAGDFYQVKQTLSQFMSSPEAKALMEKMGGGNHG